MHLHLDVWVLGDSIPFWAGKRAQDTGKENLRLRCNIAWWGERGLRWTRFRRSVEAQVLLSTPPSVIIINLGGNDLVSLPLVTLKELIKSEINYLREALPDAIIIWFDIIQRQTWSGATSGWVAMEKKRKRINGIGRYFVGSSGKSDVIKTDIDAKTGFFRPDGVHLNDVGLEFYLDYLRDALIRNNILCR
jgi:lysophospholipase L1-like esterase